jgi:ABC-2 type transport system ATP-binding protein
MEDVIAASGLRKSFTARGKAVEAVRGVDLRVGRGEIVGFLGPNGAGKTTTQRMLTTLLPIDSGRACVAGFDIARQPRQVRSRIGYVSQLGGADELATGRENLILQARLYGADKPRAHGRVDEVLDVLDLTAIADRKVKTYSGGQRRRLDVALGIVHHPEVVFLDEPSTGLDPQNRANLWEYVEGLRDRGTTIFLTTHYLEEADSLCDRVMIMDRGLIVVDGTPGELKRQAAGDSVALTVSSATGDGPAGGAGQRALALLGRASFVRDVTAEGDDLHLYVEDGKAALPELLRVLDSERISVRTVSLSEPTLDDVFLARTGRSLRDQAGTRDDEEAA